jgi:hypothetical protein
MILFNTVRYKRIYKEWLFKILIGKEKLFQKIMKLNKRNKMIWYIKLGKNKAVYP